MLQKQLSKIFSNYGQGIISDCQHGNLFSKFPSGNTELGNKPSLGHSSHLDKDVSRELME